MTQTATVKQALYDPATTEDFSIVLGGPLYQLFLRAGIVRGPMELLARRIIVLSTISWVPLLLLAIMGGRAWSGVKIPFLRDVDLHVRFLFSLPLLIFAERLVHQRIQPVMRQFSERNIIPLESRAAFNRIIDSSIRLRNSSFIEVALIALVFTVGKLVWRSQTALPSPTWYADPAPGKLTLTAAGWYYVWVSLPIFQFILLRWYFRLVVWSQFLFRVARLKLHLVPTHPDRSGGLGFLMGSAHALAPVLVAQSALLSGLIANRIFHEGARLPMFKWEIVFLTLILLLLALGPLMVFAPPLLASRRAGLREYGRLASEYVEEFHNKWLLRKGKGTDEFLGSADIQSLADLGNSFDVIREMQAFPFNRPATIRLAVIILLPLSPLILTVIPMDELLNRLIHVVV
jgi:hypothetical protein